MKSLTLNTENFSSAKLPPLRCACSPDARKGERQANLFGFAWGRRAQYLWSMSGKVKPLRVRITALLFVILAGGLVWLLARSVPPDPVYGGKRLSVWLQTYDPSSPHARGSREWSETDEAVRHIGTNAVPRLLDWLRQSDSSLKLKLVAWARKQPFIKIHFVPAATRNREASLAFVALGNNARNAVPGL